MVGSITFLKKEGDSIKKGDEVSNSQFNVCNIMHFFHEYKPGFLIGIACVILQFGYFSFGGSTVICVFEKVGTRWYFLNIKYF